MVDEPVVIPRPRVLERAPGEPFMAGWPLTVAVGDDPADVQVAVLTADRFGRATGRPVVVVTQDDGHADVVALRRVPAVPYEGYRLAVGPRRVELDASTSDGLVHGLATLFQLARSRAAGVVVPAVRVRDAPRHARRGLALHLDLGAVTPTELRTLVTQLAWYKLNLLELHVAEDLDAVPAAIGADLAELAMFGSARAVTVRVVGGAPGWVDAPGLGRVLLAPLGERVDPSPGTEALTWTVAVAVEGGDGDEGLTAGLRPRLVALAEAGWTGRPG